MGTRNPKNRQGLKANRQIKNRMFSMLFGDAASAVGLVNALLGTNYGADAKAEIVTLENVLSSGPLNDLAILLDDILLVFVEHQSTVCRNMPYRMLEYVTETYKRLIAGQNIYGESRIRLPRPVFVVLYNGAKEMGDKEFQRLSDSYSKLLPAFAGMGGLELGVTVININDKRNKNLVKSCKLLNQYCIFINVLRRNRKTMTPVAAIRKAIADCIAQGVLADFLGKHRKELISMLTAEWNWEKAIKFAADENREKGREEGREEGIEIGFERGIREEKEKNAIAMKKEGIDVKTISRITGLTKGEINRL